MFNKIGSKLSIKSEVALKKTVALVLLILATVFIVSELIVFATYMIPMMGIGVFGAQGISVDDVLVSSLSLSDAIVLLVTLVMPCLFAVGVSVYVHCKLLKVYLKAAKVWFLVIFKRKNNEIH